jgi:hypothetical protein
VDVNTVELWYLGKFLFTRLHIRRNTHSVKFGISSDFYRVHVRIGPNTLLHGWYPWLARCPESTIDILFSNVHGAGRDLIDSYFVKYHVGEE